MANNIGFSYSYFIPSFCTSIVQLYSNSSGEWMNNNQAHHNSYNGLQCSNWRRNYQDLVLKKTKQLYFGFAFHAFLHDFSFQDNDKYLRLKVKRKREDFTFSVNTTFSPPPLQVGGSQIQMTSRRGQQKIQQIWTSTDNRKTLE